MEKFDFLKVYFRKKSKKSKTFLQILSKMIQSKMLNDRIPHLILCKYCHVILHFLSNTKMCNITSEPLSLINCIIKINSSTN